MNPAGPSPPRLLPRPRSVVVRPEVVATPLDHKVEVRHAALRDQAYRLLILPGSPHGRIVIECSGAPGERHARATLAQLRAQYNSHLPALTIDDAPAIARRGFMLDVSRCRVPTMSSLERIVRLLASLKFNHLQLYTEHTFAYAGHQDIWYGSDPLTPEEVRLLDQWCREAGISLAANQNCFGHLRRWLRHPRYAPLAETHGVFRFIEWNRAGPHSLCPHDPGSMRLVEDWLSQLLPCFSSGLINLGCDETFDVGAGRSRSRALRDGEGTVRLGFVGQLCAAALRRGARPMIWGDMIAAHPEAAHLVPPEAIALMWGYEPDTDFETMIESARTASAGRTCWVCPGTSSWLSIFGRGLERTENLRRAAQTAVRHNAEGLLVCDWGDQGHRQQWPVTLRALADAAEAAWTGASQRSVGDGPERVGLASPDAASLHLFGDPTGRVVPALDELSECDAVLRGVCGGAGPDGAPRPLKNASALYRDLHTGLAEAFPAGAEGTGHSAGKPRNVDPRDAGPWRAIAIPARAVRDAAAGLQPLLRQEVEITLDTALVARDRAVARREGMSPNEARNLAEHVADLIARSRQTWQARSREGGRAESAAFDERVRQELLRLCSD